MSLFESKSYQPKRHKSMRRKAQCTSLSRFNPNLKEPMLPTKESYNCKALDSKAVLENCILYATAEVSCYKVQEKEMGASRKMAEEMSKRVFTRGMVEAC